MRRIPVESILAVLAGLVAANCKGEQKPIEAEPNHIGAGLHAGPSAQPAAAPAAASVAAREVPAAAPPPGAQAPADSAAALGSTAKPKAKETEKKCAPGGCGPGK